MISSSLVAADDWLDADILQGDPGFDVYVTGTFVGTVTVQVSPDQGATWVDTDTFDAPGVKTARLAKATAVRVGFKPGDYVSGTAIAWVS